MPHWKGGCEPFWDAEELKPLLRGLGWAQRVLRGRELVAHSVTRRLGTVSELRQGSVRCVRQYSFMETRFLTETQFTFDEISCYLIKVLPEAYSTWTSLSHPPQFRGASLAQPGGFSTVLCP